MMKLFISSDRENNFLLFDGKYLNITDIALEKSTKDAILTVVYPSWSQNMQFTKPSKCLYVLLTCHERISL